MADSTPAYKTSNSVYYAIIHADAKPTSKNKSPVVGWQSVPYPVVNVGGTSSVDRSKVPSCPDTGSDWSFVFLPNVTDAQWTDRATANPQIAYVTDGTDIFPAS